MKKSKWKRLLSSLLTAAMLAGCIPASASASTVSAAAAETNEARIIDRSTYEKLGFNLDLSTTDESFLGPGNTTLNTKNELYLNYNGSSNYGWMLRDNLDFNHENWTNYKTIGAYKLYGQYRNGDWAHLNDDNGYTYGQTGGQESVIGSDIHSENTHQNRAYETSTEYRSASGRLDRVAQIYVVAGKERKDYKVSLELLKFVKDSSGKYVEQTLKYTTLSNSIPALDETGCFYNQSYDALFDITAGDFNGDGVDEVAVYYGTNEVKIYKTSGDKLTLWQTIEADDILKDKKITEKKNADSTEGGVQRAAIVTLAAGDLKKDYSEDLVITVSMPQGATESAHKNNPYTYIFGNSDGGYLSKDEEIALKGDYQGTPQVFKAANAAIGDLDGDSSVELVIGGRLCPESGVNDCGWNQGRLIYVKYNHGTKKYDIDYSNSIELKEQDGTNVLTKAHNDDVQYFAPVGMAVADLDGTGEQQPYLLFFAELFTYSSETGFTATGNVMDTIRKQKNNADESEDKTQHWVSDVVVGNFNNNDKMAQQIVAIVACKQSGDDSYWYYMSYIAMNDSGKICAQSEGILNQAGGYLNQSEKKRAAPYVSIACPDVDEDSILMEFAGAKSYYSKPEVFSVLQSAPYFEDVNEVYDNYLNNGATAFGTVSGVSNGATSSIETKLGIYAETEVSLFASTGMEMDISVKTSYDHTSSWNNTTSIEYAGSVGDDYVVMYTIPYHRYYYNATYEDGKKDIITIEEPLTPSTVIVPVEVYDEIAAETEGIEPIRGNILTSTPGDPSTYTEWGKGKFEPISEVNTLTNAGPNSGSTITASKESTLDREHTVMMGVEENYQIGWGAKFLGNGGTMGVQQGFSITAGYARTESEGTVYTGTVDNLPYGVSGYAFNWQFGISKTTLNDEEITVIGYKTSNVKSAPSIPKDLAVVEITDSSVTLEWSPASDAAMYEVFGSKDQNNENWLPQGTVSAAAVNEKGMMRYTVTGLSSNDTYYFTIESADAYGKRSMKAQPVTATTLSDNNSFTILKHPADTSAATGYPASFNVQVITEKAEKINYQWQYYDGENWQIINSNNSNTLNISNVSEDMDGRQYRCRVSQSMNYFYTRSAKLTVDKNKSSASIVIKSGDKTLKSGDKVAAAASELKDITENITIWQVNPLSANNTTYTKVATVENTSEKGGDTEYDYSGAVCYWMDADGRLYNVAADGSVGSEADTSERFVFNYTSGSVKKASYTATDKTEGLTPVTVADGVSASSGYLINGTGTDAEPAQYVYTATVQSDGENITKYYMYDGSQYTEAFLGGSETVVKVGEGESSVNYITNELYKVKEKEVVEVVTGQETVTTDGDKLKFTANIPKDADGKVYFVITNDSTGTSANIAASGGNGVYTADYTFTEAGVYDICAVYSGNNIYYSSRSESVQIYVCPGSDVLNIAGGNITYGQSLDLSPEIYSKDSEPRVVSGVSYTVKKYVKKQSDKESSYEEVSGLISGNNFKPAETGNYVISAVYKDGGKEYTAVSEIKVNAKTLTISAPDIKLGLSSTEAERRAELASDDNYVSGLQKGDTVSYELTTDAVKAKAQGDYRIDVKLISDRAALEKKYSIVMLSGIFTLDQNSKRVKAEAGPNGNVGISYTTTIEDTEGNPYTSESLDVESGALVPVGAHVTITAVPNSGFGVENWTVNGQKIDSTNAVYSIENLNSDYEIKVSFAYTYNSLSFMANNGEGGTVSGVYSGSSSVFNSGSAINSNQKVVLTAEPKDGYAVSKWECTVDGETEVLKNGDGVTNYTGLTYTVSNVSESTTYVVYFEKVKEADVIVKFTDKSGVPVSGCSLSVNGVQVKGNGNTFTYSAKLHENLEIVAAVPGNMLIDHWDLGESAAAGAVNKINIYDLEGSRTYTVICVTPNQCKVAFDKELTGENGGTAEAAGTVSAVREGVEGALSSNASMPQGAVINFTAQPADGYRVNKWVVNGKEAAGTDVKTYSLTLQSDSSITVYFEKKPVINVSNDALKGAATGVNSGQYVEFGSEVQINIEPKAGYIVDNVKADGKTVELNIPANTDNRYIVLENVTKNTDIEIAYKAKPIVTITDVENVDINVSATKDFNDYDILNASYVDFGTSLSISAAPEKGYVVESVLVNNYPVTITPKKNSDNVTASVDNIQSDTVITVTYRALTTSKVKFSVVDKNDEAVGGTDGTLTASADRKSMAAYAVNSDDSGELTVYEGSTVTFDAVPDAGYKITKWFVNGKESSTQPAINVTADMAEQDIRVQFDYVGEKITYAVSGAADKAVLSATFTPDGGTEQDFISGNKPGTDGVIRVTVNNLDENYEIEGWYVNGKKAEGEDGLTFEYDAVVNVGADITVNIVRCSYTVEFSAENGSVSASAGGDTVISGDSITGDTEVTFTALPKENTGYIFTGWNINGKDSEETSETLTLTITENVKVKAVYELNAVKYTVTYGVISGETGEDGEAVYNGTLAAKRGNSRIGSSPAQVAAGSDLTFTAVPDDNYIVEGWYSDAEGTNEIEGTKAEQLTYSTTNLVNDLTVYVKFKIIPKYTIDMTVKGLGKVTAKVNGEDVEFTDGKLVVQHHDNVTLTAVPDKFQYLGDWKVDGVSKGNKLELELVDITADTSVEAEFLASQNIEFKTIINKNHGSIEVKTGDEEESKINPETGITIHKGQNVEMTVTPKEGMMVKEWIVNGRTWVISDESKTDYIDQKLVLENVIEDTTVEVVFEGLKLYSIPEGTNQYVIKNIKETPVDIGGEKKVRERGTVEFDVAAVYPNVITAITADAGEGSVCSAVQNSDGSWTVKAENVKSDISVTPVIAEGKPMTVNCSEGGSVTVTLNGDVIDNNRVLALGDVITIKAAADTGYKLDKLTVNEKNFTNEKTYTVLDTDEAVVINASFSVQSSGGGGGGGGGAAVSKYEIVTEQTPNGIIAVNPEKEAAKGDSVVITVKPDAGYKAGSAVVTDKNGKMIEVTKNADGTYVFRMPDSKVNVKVNFIVKFTDVADDSYYAGAADWALENGITTGTSAVKFSPDATCTRAQAVTFLWRSAGSPEPENTEMKFTDVAADAYYYNAVLWAVENGITKGVSADKFSPDAECTRSHIVTFLWRFQKSPVSNAVNPFIDVAKDAYYANAVLWAVENGITTGTSVNKFSPENDCTRAQIVTFLYRCFINGK